MSQGGRMGVLRGCPADGALPADWPRNQTSGKIEAIRIFAEVNATAVNIVLKEGRHPFTIASAWEPSTRRVRFISTGLGDYTHVLPKTLADAGVALHVLVDHQDGFLTGERLRKLVPHWKSASVWLCGLAAFGQALRGDLVANGLTTNHFHQVVFNMREGNEGACSG